MLNNLLKKGGFLVVFMYIIFGWGFLLSAGAESPKGEVTIAQPLLIQYFDPINHKSSSDWLPHTMLFDGLVNLGPEGRYPALATSWTVNPKELTMDFNLRRGVKFHNGDEVTAKDVKFTFEKILSPDSVHNRRKTFVRALKNVEILDNYKVRFHLKRPWADFFTSSRSAGLQQIVPKDYYEKVGAEGFQNKPVGTGPFKLVEAKKGVYSKYEAFTEYWDQVPSVKYINKLLVVEPFTRYAMIERGEADIVMGITGPLLKKIRENPDLRVISARYSGTSILACNRRDVQVCNDRRFRLAIAHAINRDAIAETVLGGVCEPAAQHMTPGTFGYDPSIKPIKYDPEKAKKLFAEVGIKDGFEISMSMHTESFGSLPNGPGVLEAIAGYLEALGLKVRREPAETGAWLTMMRGGKQPGLFYGPSSVPDDGGSLIETWYSDRAWCKEPCTVGVPTYQLIADVTNQESDPEKREVYLQDWAKLDSIRVEMIPLYWCNTPYAISKRIAKWTPGLGSPYHMHLQSLVTID
jgi:peptide/nickel transport system substrate-binding protein